MIFFRLSDFVVDRKASQQIDFPTRDTRAVEV